MVGGREIFSARIGSLLPTVQDWIACKWTLVRSTLIGFVIGSLPGAGATVSAFMAYAVLVPLILLFVLLGAYTVGGAMSDLWIMFAFGLVGYLMRKFDYPAAPLLLALVLGPVMERNLKLSLTISQGSLLIFFQRPITLIIFGLIVLSLGWPLLVFLFSRKKEAVEIPIGEEI